METLLRRRGHTLVDFEAAADAYIINTCTVTAVSDKKSRQAIRRARRRSLDGVVAVCGCYGQTHPEALAGLGIDLISGTGDHTAFLDRVEALARQKQAETLMQVDQVMGRRQFELLPAGGLEGRTRAMLKVEDGCVNFCTYCIIPYARGPVRSMALGDAEREAARLAAEGYRELVLTGIEISSWGRDLPGRPELAELVEAVCGAAPGCRVRLGSLEPRTVTPEFCRRAAALDNLCPHFHLSLQSGCDGVLKRMNRKYDTARYWESAVLLRQAFDRPAITTDLIVGFPGETEEEFEATLAFVEKCGFSAMHIFPYSRRAGTPAAGLPGQCPNAVREERAHRAGELARRLEREWLSQWRGETLEVLFEEEKDGLWQGHTTRYTQVRAGGDGLHNQLRQVEIVGVEGEGLLGRVKGPETRRGLCPQSPAAF